MQFYNELGNPIKSRKNTPKNAYYLKKGNYVPVPSINNSTRNEIVDCVCSGFSKKEIENKLNEVDYNDDIVRYLSTLKDQYFSDGEVWKCRAYAKGISNIKNQDIPILSGSQAMLINGVGKSMAQKIDEFLELKND